MITLKSEINEELFFTKNLEKWGKDINPISKVVSPKLKDVSPVLKFASKWKVANPI